MLSCACAGLPLDRSTVLAWLTPEDLADIEAGRISADCLRAHAEYLARVGLPTEEP